jgi:hypothetical protein
VLVCVLVGVLVGVLEAVTLGVRLIVGVLLGVTLIVGVGLKATGGNAPKSTSTILVENAVEYVEFNNQIVFV